MIAVGAILNHRYRVTELVGTGGMAHVYRAVNLATRKPVAIKVLKDEFQNNPDFLRRFEREARAVLHLSHDNIVRAYGVGQYDGLPFIVLEFVEGRTLKQIIQDEGPMNPRAASEILCQILDALTAAHQAGIIHRDIKPQNVIVTLSGKAKLTDFGIARDADADTQTYSGSTVLGSVHYLSPEQAKGKPVSEASDLYSAGITLYEMLTGSVPFNGDNSVSIALKHLNEKPVPVIERNPRVPPALSDVVMKALSKNAADRYASAAAMRADILRAQYDPYGDFVNQGNAPRVPSGNTGRIRIKKSRRKGITRIAAAVVLIIGILTTAFFSIRSSLTDSPAAVQIVPTLTARTVDDAALKAENYGFTFEIEEYETSDTVPFGQVILQSPTAGVRAKQGSVIRGIVSLGPSAPSVPNLIGLTPDDAHKAIEDAGLNPGTTQYVVSDVALGYVCQQSPAPGSETQLGETVNIYVSASANNNIYMPGLNGSTLEDVLNTLNVNGFSHIFVRFVSHDDIAPDLVLSQSPSEATLTQTDVPVVLQVSIQDAYPCAADVAFNIRAVSESGTQVRVTVAEALGGVRYERILFEKSLEKGDNVPVAFTAYTQQSGIYELILYVDGTVSKRQDFTFR